MHKQLISVAENCPPQLRMIMKQQPQRSGSGMLSVRRVCENGSGITSAVAKAGFSGRWAARNILLKAQYGDPHRLHTQDTKGYHKSCS